jgi:3alpha(or 20beta)-hydroxysteroid dehydrogenase
MDRLTNRTAIVTGASRGLGAAIARALAENGARVVLCDIRDEVEQRAAELTVDGFDALGLRLDVRSEEEWAAVIKQAVDRFGEISILINNAGITSNLPFEDVTLAEFQAIIDVNLYGAFRGMKAVLPSMKKTGNGAIINIASTTTDQILSIAPCYGASKAALANLTKSAALHCAEKNYGIRVNSVHPGTHATDMVLDAGMAVDHPAAQAIINSIPMKRMGRPEEVGKVVAFLASDDASYMTGTEIFVDGGAVTV